MADFLHLGSLLRDEQTRGERSKGGAGRGGGKGMAGEVKEEARECSNRAVASTTSDQLHLHVKIMSFPHEMKACKCLSQNKGISTSSSLLVHRKSSSISASAMYLTTPVLFPFSSNTSFAPILYKHNLPISTFSIHIISWNLSTRGRASIVIGLLFRPRPRM